MRMVGVSDAKKNLTALLNDVEGGAQVTITRRNKPIARLVRVEAGFDRAKARQAAEGLRALSKTTTLGGLTLKALREEGRR